MEFRLLYSLNFLKDGKCAVGVMFLRATSGKSYDLTCEICGGTMVERNCKIKCPNCGFTRDCSDP